jgi:uncharacterized protein (TIGR03435 family)
MPRELAGRMKYAMDDGAPRIDTFMRASRKAAIFAAQTCVLMFLPGVVMGQPGAGASAASVSATQPGTAYTPTFAFDVATVKEATNEDGSSIDNPLQSSRFQGFNLTAEGLILAAYHMHDATLHGGPSWIHTVRFDVEAKSDHSVDEALAKLSRQDAVMEKQHMLQVLLTERFNLKTHKETTMGRTYELVKGKGAPNLRQTVNPDPTYTGTICGNTEYSRRGRRLVPEHCSMKALVNELTMVTGSPVVDKTGLAGSYAFTLQWNGITDSAPVSATGDSTLDPFDPLLTAIRDQLGLVLKPTTGPIENLVIDHIEKPSPN